MSSSVLFIYMVIGFLIVNVQCTCNEGEVVTLEPYRPTVIESPGLQNGSYPSNVSCSWKVENAGNTSVIKTYLQIDVYRLGCPTDYLRIYSGISTAGVSFYDDFECNSDTNRTKTLVIQGPAFVVFKSGDNVTESSIGFRLTFLSANDSSENSCTEDNAKIAEEREQFITSPSFPLTYPINNNCSWNISTNGSSRVELALYFLDVDFNINCTYHRLEITVDGNTTVLCDKAEWEVRKYQGDEIIISFQSDDKNSRVGFLLGYKAIRRVMTTEKQTTEQPTIPPHYWNQMLLDYYVYPDYNYFGWNEPVVTTPPPVQPVTTHAPVTQSPNSWSNWWEPFFYFWMF